MRLRLKLSPKMRLARRGLKLTTQMRLRRRAADETTAKTEPPNETTSPTTTKTDHPNETTPPSRLKLAFQILDQFSSVQFSSVQFSSIQLLRKNQIPGCARKLSSMRTNAAQY